MTVRRKSRPEQDAFGTASNFRPIGIGRTAADYPDTLADAKPEHESRLAAAVAFLKATPSGHADRTVAAIKRRFGLTAKAACEALAIANRGGCHGA